MKSTAIQLIREWVWPEIEAMMWHDAHFRLVLAARQLTGNLKGPTGKLIDNGYLVYQMVSIRRICGKEDDVISLRTVLKKAREEQAHFRKEIDQLSGHLSECDHVCKQANKHVTHTANPEARNWEEWKMDLQDLEKAHKAICQVAIILDRDILHWGRPFDIIPVHQYYSEDLMLWVPENLREKLNQAWHENLRRVDAWKSARSL